MKLVVQQTAVATTPNRLTVPIVADEVIAHRVALVAGVSFATIARTGIAVDNQSESHLGHHRSLLIGESEHVKQADQSWGAPTGGSEWDDEKAGEQIAKEDAGDGFGPSENAPTNAEGEKPDGESGQTEAVPGGEAAEAEKVGKSYDEYLAEQLEKRANLGSSLEARKANEGSKADKKWANAKPISKDEEEDSYISGKGGKTTRQRERKEKQTVEIDHRFQEAPRGDRGGRGRGRGGDFRGDRGGGRGRGRGDGFRGESRGEYRGNRGGGGRGGRGENVNVSDENAFPSLGA